jgi:hypothetical protein
MNYGKGRSHGDSAKSLILYGNIGSDRKVPAVVLGRITSGQPEDVESKIGRVAARSLQG